MSTTGPLDLETRVATLEHQVAELTEKLDHAETLAGIERGLHEVNSGLGRPAKDVVEELRTRYNLPRS